MSKKRRTLWTARMLFKRGGHDIGSRNTTGLEFRGETINIESFSAFDFFDMRVLDSSLNLRRNGLKSRWGRSS